MSNRRFFNNQRQVSISYGRKAGILNNKAKRNIFKGRLQVDWFLAIFLASNRKNNWDERIKSQCETNYWPIAVNKEQTNQMRNLTDLSWSWIRCWIAVWNPGASQVWLRIKKHWGWWPCELGSGWGSCELGNFNNSCLVQLKLGHQPVSQLLRGPLTSGS